MANILGQLTPIAYRLVDVVFHVELEEIVLPHEDVLSLIDLRVQRHEGILSHINTLLECVLDSRDIPVNDL